MRRFLIVLALVACSRERHVADIVFVNGHIITVDSADRVAQAVAVKDGRIFAVGTTAAIDSLVGASTERVDLGGLTMTPGLLDAHAHFANGAVDRLYVLDLSYPNVTSIRGVLDSVAARVAALPKGSWVIGRGWDEGKLAERRLIQAADLDRVSPDHPVWLTQTMGHYGVANSAALRLAQIGRDTKDPPGWDDRPGPRTARPQACSRNQHRGSLGVSSPTKPPSKSRRGSATWPRRSTPKG